MIQLEKYKCINKINRESKIIKFNAFLLKNCAILLNVGSEEYSDLLFTMKKIYKKERNLYITEW